MTTPTQVQLLLDWIETQDRPAPRVLFQQLHPGFLGGPRDRSVVIATQCLGRSPFSYQILGYIDNFPSGDDGSLDERWANYENEFKTWWGQLSENGSPNLEPGPSYLTWNDTQGQYEGSFFQREFELPFPVYPTSHVQLYQTLLKLSGARKKFRRDFQKEERVLWLAQIQAMERELQELLKEVKRAGSI